MHLFIAAAIGGLANLVAALFAVRARAVDGAGAIAGWTLGTVIWTAATWRGHLLLVAFVVAGTAATRLGWERKVAQGLAQENGGRRGVRHAVANAGVAAVAGVLAAATSHPDLWLAALAGAFATATADTLSSEVGLLWGGRPRLVTNFRRVERGTDGAISGAGTLAALAGAAGIAVLGGCVGLYGPAGIASVTAAGFLGGVVDSVLGATLEPRGLLDNEGVNFTATLIGAAIALSLAAVAG